MKPKFKRGQLVKVCDDRQSLTNYSHWDSSIGIVYSVYIDAFLKTEYFYSILIIDKQKDNTYKPTYLCSWFTEMFLEETKLDGVDTKALLNEYENNCPREER